MAYLSKYYLDDNRTPTFLKQLPKNLVDALVAYRRWHDILSILVDARGTIRAFAYLGSKGGASTISQQLAKQGFLRGLLPVAF